MEYKETVEFLKELTEAKGISGNEKEASRVMKKYLEGYADSFEYDNLGSLIAVKRGTSDLQMRRKCHLLYYGRGYRKTIRKCRSSFWEVYKLLNPGYKLTCPRNKGERGCN